LCGVDVQASGPLKPTLISAAAHGDQHEHLFYFLAFFQEIFSNTPPMERFQKMDPELSAIHAGAKITPLGAVDVGAKPPGHLADDAELALTWQRLAWRHRHWRQVWRHGSWHRAVGIS
jgi:hypothetical protein